MPEGISRKQYKQYLLLVLMQTMNMTAIVMTMPLLIFAQVQFFSADPAAIPTTTLCQGCL